MFLPNKYTKWYNQLIEKAQNREAPAVVEGHHIIPKALGGNNEKENIVKLTPREHFIAHVLLIKMVDDPKHKRAMCLALLIMKQSNGNYCRIGNGKLYEKVRLSVRESYSGENATFYGKTHSIETKQKISAIHKGKKLTDAHIQSIKFHQTGRKQSNELKQRRIEALAQSYVVVFPDGKTEEIKNMHEFCKAYGLNPAHMSSVVNGKRKHHKQYKAHKV